MSAIRKSEAVYRLEEQPKKVVRTVKKVQTKRRIVLNKQALLYVSVGMVVFLVAFATVFRYATIAEANVRIAKEKKAVDELKSKNQQLEVQMQYMTDLKKVEDYAKYSLGMHRPEKYQIVHVALPTEDFAEVTKPKEDKNLFSKVIGFFGQTLEYLN